MNFKAFLPRVHTLIVCCFLFLVVSPVKGSPFGGTNLEFSGFLESRHGIQIKKSNPSLASETHLRLEATAHKDEFNLFTSINLSENHLMGEESGLLLHEAYVDAVFGNLDLRLGRQIIIWGNSDSSRITDQISPMDLSEYITRSFDEIRMGVDALNLRYNWASGTSQFIWIPRYRAGQSPDSSSPWYLGHITEGYKVLPPSGPGDQTGHTFFDNGFSDSELAFKQSIYLAGADLAFSHFYTWQDNPIYTFGTLPHGTAYAKPRIHRRNITGLEFSKSLGENVFRAEAAWFWNDVFQTGAAGPPPQKRHRIKWLAALDWYPGDQWTLALEYSQSHILNHDSALMEPVVRHQIFARASKKLFREKLKLTGMLYFDPRVKDSLVRLSAEYLPVDDLVLTLGADIFSQGDDDKQGTFAPYDKKDQIWGRLKYYF